MGAGRASGDEPEDGTAESIESKPIRDRENLTGSHLGSQDDQSAVEDKIGFFSRPYLVSFFGVIYVPVALTILVRLFESATVLVTIIISPFLSIPLDAIWPNALSVTSTLLRSTSPLFSILYVLYFLSLFDYYFSFSSISFGLLGFFYKVWAFYFLSSFSYISIPSSSTSSINPSLSFIRSLNSVGV